MEASDARRGLVDYMKEPGFVKDVTKNAANRARKSRFVKALSRNMDPVRRRHLCALVALETVEVMLEELKRREAAEVF